MYSQAELINWLRDLHAMEKAMECALKKLTQPPHPHEALREQAARHAIESRQHAAVLADCLAQLGATTLPVQSAAVQGVDFTRGAGAAFSQDERIKDVLTVLVTAHFQIACHSIVHMRASQLGLREIVNQCETVVHEKKRLVKWLQLNLPEILSLYLSPEEEDEEAEENLMWERNSPARDTAQWEFVQLAPSAALFGGTLSRASFAHP